MFLITRAKLRLMKGSAQKRLLLGNQCKEQYCVVQTKNPDPAGPAWPSGLSCGFSCSLRKVPGSIPGAAISVRTAASVLGLVAGSRLRQTCTVCRSRRFYDLGAEFGTLQAPFRMHSRFKMPRTHPGWVRDTFTIQNARSRGRIRASRTRSERVRDTFTIQNARLRTRIRHVPDPSRMGSGHIHGSNRPHHRELHPKVLIFDSFCHKNRSTAWGLLFSKSDFSSFLKIDTLNLIKKMHFFGSEIDRR